MNINGCKHSKVDQKNAPVYKSHDFLGQMPISSSKCGFKLIVYHDVVKLDTQI